MQARLKTLKLYFMMKVVPTHDYTTETWCEAKKCAI